MKRWIDKKNVPIDDHTFSASQDLVNGLLSTEHSGDLRFEGGRRWFLVVRVGRRRWIVSLKLLRCLIHYRFDSSLWFLDVIVSHCLYYSFDCRKCYRRTLFLRRPGSAVHYNALMQREWERGRECLKLVGSGSIGDNSTAAVVEAKRPPEETAFVRSPVWFKWSTGTGETPLTCRFFAGIMTSWHLPCRTGETWVLWNIRCTLFDIFCALKCVEWYICVHIRVIAGSPNLYPFYDLLEPKYTNAGYKMGHRKSI